MLNTSPAATTFQESPKADSAPDNKAGVAAGIRIYQNAFNPVKFRDFALNNFSRFSGFFSKPFFAEVITIGRHIKTETKTGTTSEVNQNKAGRIKAITGVARINSSGKSKKAEKAFESAAVRPKKNPRINEIKKEIMTRRKVKAKAFQKTVVTDSSNNLLIT